MGEDAATAVRQHLAASTPSPVLGRPLAELDRQVMDWSMPDPPPVQVRDGMVFIGRYLEERSVYHTAAYETHLGVRADANERQSGRVRLTASATAIDVPNLMTVQRLGPQAQT